MLLIIGTIRFPAKSLKQAIPDLRRLIEATRRESGCTAYNYSEDVLDPGLIHIDELWVDRPAFENHLVSPHVLEWRAASANFGIYDRHINVYEVGSPCPL